MAFFAPAIIGLDISDRSVEAVLLLRKGGRITLTSTGRILLPPGLVSGGVIEKRDDLAAAVRKLLADRMTPPIPARTLRAVIALPEPQVFSHIFEVPRIADESELARSLAIETDAFFPYNHREMVASQVTIAQKPDKKEIYYAAVHKDTLRGFLEFCGAAKIAPEAFEPESAAIARACIQPNEREPVMIIDIGARITNLSVFDRNGIHFSESVSTAGDAFDAAVAKALGVTVEQAEERRKAEGLGIGLESKAAFAMRVEISKLADDVRTAVAFYERRSGLKVARGILCGGVALTPGFQGVLQEVLTTPEMTLAISVADPWLGIDIGPELEKMGIKPRGVLMATAVGLALRGVRVRKFAELDFLPKNRSERRISIVASGISVTPTQRATAAVKKAPLALKLGIAVVAFLVLAAGVWATAFKLIPSLRGTTPPVVEPDPIATAANPRVIELPAKLGGVSTEGVAWIEALPVAVELPVQKSVTREGAEVEGIARGVVTLKNESGTAQNLVARTRLLSESGVLFRLIDRAVIPARGEVRVDVEADQPGPSGDIGPSRFTIPGLSASQQKVMYGVSDAPMTGGVTRQSGPVTAEEIEAIKKELADNQADLLFTAAQAKGEGLVVLWELFSVRGVRTIEAPAVGSSVGSYVFKGMVDGTVLAFRESDVRAVLQAEAGQDTLIKVEYLDIVPDHDAQTATMTLQGAFEGTGEEPEPEM